MMRLVALVAIGAALCAMGCASGESFVKPGYDFRQVDRVAVVQVECPGESRAVKNAIAEDLKFEFFKRGYNMIEREQVQAILDEQKFQRSGVTTTEDAVQAGRILNVDGALIVNVPEFGDRIVIKAEMVDVETGEVVWMGRGKGTTGKTIATVAGAVAGGAAGVAVGGDRTGRVVGGLAGGALGGVAGHELTPEGLTQITSVIARVCDTLPYRIAPSKP